MKFDFLTSTGNARSYSLDLEDQYQGLENGGQFRFTPPTHAMLAFRQALQELEAEGGVQGRSHRSLFIVVFLMRRYVPLISLFAHVYWAMCPLRVPI